MWSSKVLESFAWKGLGACGLLDLAMMIPTLQCVLRFFFSFPLSRTVLKCFVGGWPISLVDILANLEAADRNQEFLLPAEVRRRFEMPKVGRQSSVEILEGARIADQCLASLAISTGR